MTPRNIQGHTPCRSLTCCPRHFPCNHVFVVNIISNGSLPVSAIFYPHSLFSLSSDRYPLLSAPELFHRSSLLNHSWHMCICGNMSEHSLGHSLMNRLPWLAGEGCHATARSASLPCLGQTSRGTLYWVFGEPAASEPWCPRQ